MVSIADRRMLIAVTGTPGTGKSHFAGMLARFLGGAKLIEINEVVERDGLYSGIDRDGSKIVKMGPLTRRLKSEVRKSRTTTILVGHLAADIGMHYDICVVTRSNLSRLVKVFGERHYGKEKARENMFAEALDYCGVEAGKRAKETYEVETQKDKREVICYIKARLENKRVKKPELARISKMDELLHKIKSKGMSL